MIGKARLVFYFILIVALFWACSDASVDGSEGKVENNFQVVVDSSGVGSRQIIKEEYDVYKLHFEISGAITKSFDWVPGSNAEYNFSLSEGSYKVSVIHYATNKSGHEIQAAESVEFDILPMKVTIIRVVPGLTGNILIQTNNNGSSSSSSSISSTNMSSSSSSSSVSSTNSSSSSSVSSTNISSSSSSSSSSVSSVSSSSSSSSSSVSSTNSSSSSSSSSVSSTNTSSTNL